MREIKAGKKSKSRISGGNEIIKIHCNGALFFSLSLSPLTSDWPISAVLLKTVVITEKSKKNPVTFNEPSTF